MTEARQPQRWMKPLQPRDRDEAHRAATPLELLTDLCFVVAVSRAVSGLHHAVSEGHALVGLGHYGVAFFAIWWAWVNFAWFSSAFDNDDAFYRTLALLQIVGVLVLAAGLRGSFTGGNEVAIAGYVIMRVALVAQWLRVARADLPHRRTARRYAAGLFACQCGWILLLAIPGEARPWAFAGLAAAELLVPVWGEAAGETPWHAGHVAERYGLFTIIILGEILHAATVAIETALEGGATLVDLLPISLGGVLVVFSMWWLYFAKPGHRVLVDLPSAFRWGYGHYVVFAAGAAVGAGLEIEIDRLTRESRASATVGAAFVTFPVAAYLSSLWHIVIAPHAAARGHGGYFAVAVPLVLAATFTPEPVLLTGVVCAGLLVLLLSRRRASRRNPRKRGA